MSTDSFPIHCISQFDPLFTFSAGCVNENVFLRFKDHSTQASSLSVYDTKFEQDNLKAKHDALQHAYARKNLPKLAVLATEAGGLLTDEWRCKIWPLFLGFDASDVNSTRNDDWKNLPVHADEKQVSLDVDRATTHYYHDSSAEERENHKKQLNELITQVLRQNPRLCYFQGYHDIAQVLLNALGIDLAVPALCQLSLLRVRDFMLPTLAGTTEHLKLIMPIIGAIDGELCQHLSHVNPYFGVSLLITYCAHEVQIHSQIARLFDFLIAQDAVVSIYFIATLILTRRDELLAVPSSEPELLHHKLSHLSTFFDLDDIISQSLINYRRYPPYCLHYKNSCHDIFWSGYGVTRGNSEKSAISYNILNSRLYMATLNYTSMACVKRFLSPWSGISRHSVLKTMRISGNENFPPRISQFLCSQHFELYNAELNSRQSWSVGPYVWDVRRTYCRAVYSAISWSLTNHRISASLTFSVMVILLSWYLRNTANRPISTVSRAVLDRFTSIFANWMPVGLLS